jgi:hypothetical protein
MDVEIVKREILQAFSDGPQPVWRMPSPARVELWWKGGYTQIEERETEYLVRINSCDSTPPGTPARRFHWVDRKDKGPHQHDDRRTVWSACFVLKAHDENGAKLRFAEDPVFGLIQADNGRDDYWTGVATLDFFYGREVTIHLDLMEGGSVSDLHAWYRAFLSRQQEVRTQIEPRIVEYARWYADRIDADLGFAGIEDLPRHLNPQGLTLYPRPEWEDQFQVKSKFHWDASWDGEHGVTARLHDWTIIDVGLDYC